MTTGSCTGWANPIRRSVLSGFLAAMTVGGAEVKITIVDTAGFSDRTMGRARATLGDIFNGAGLEIRWHGTPTNSSYVPVNSRKNSEFHQRSGQANDEQRCRASRSIYVRIMPDLPRRYRRCTLGYARPSSVDGINITIFESTVTATATVHGLDPGQVLGHAIAHEVGHVLLHSAPHDAHGLMAAAWGTSEFDLMHRVTLRFRSRQVEVMKNTVTAEGCYEEGDGYRLAVHHPD